MRPSCGVRRTASSGPRNPTVVRNRLLSGNDGATIDTYRRGLSGGRAVQAWAADHRAQLGHLPRATHDEGFEGNDEVQCPLEQSGSRGWSVKSWYSRWRNLFQVRLVRAERSNRCSSN